MCQKQYNKTPVIISGMQAIQQSLRMNQAQLATGVNYRSEIKSTIGLVSAGVRLSHVHMRGCMMEDRDIADDFVKFVGLV